MDSYSQNSLKEQTRQCRVKSNQKLVRDTTVIPKNWYDFLRMAESTNYVIVSTINQKVLFTHLRTV